MRRSSKRKLYPSHIRFIYYVNTIR